MYRIVMIFRNESIRGGQTTRRFCSIIQRKGNTDVGVPASPHIWSPPALQGPVYRLTGTDCCHISDLCVGGLLLSGLDVVRAYRPHQPIGFKRRWGEQVFNTPV